MWYDDDPFLQLPYMTYDRLKELRKKYKNLPFELYCKMPKEERKKLTIFDDDDQLNEVEKAIDALPLVDVEIKWGVEGENEIAVGDILTISLRVTHANLQEKENLGFIHSNRFPYLK